MSLFKKTIASAAASALAVLGAVSAGGIVPQASAAEHNLVAFGDSVLADPGMGVYLQARLSSQQTGANCPNSDNYAKRTAAKLGLDVADYSCSGAVSMSQGPQMWNEVNEAIRTGALGPQTARVIYTGGFNDTYNNSGMDMQTIRNAFVAANVPIINRIREVAPNARIQIVGYPTIGSNDRYCLFHLGNNILLDSTALPQVRDYEDKAQWMQVDLANATGTQFVDLKPSTANNGMCARDEDRMWAGLIDFGAGPGNLPLHLNTRGQEHAANVVAAS